jgi:hypothetical protein
LRKQKISRVLRPRTKIPAPLTFIALLFATISASAQNETACHETAYDYIIQTESSMKKKKSNPRTRCAARNKTTGHLVLSKTNKRATAGQEAHPVEVSSRHPSFLSLPRRSPTRSESA